MNRSFAGFDSTMPTSRLSPPAQGTSDDALVAGISDRNKLAMQLLFVRHHMRVYRFIFRMVGNSAVAEDLTSEVFISVWRQAAKFNAESTVSTWLLAIARYRSLAELRLQRKEIGVGGPAMAEPAADDPDVALQAKDRRRVVRACLAQLSPEHRAIIDLVYYHEKTVREVATIVGIPPNTVKTRMFYARRKLSELLAAADIDGTCA